MIGVFQNIVEKGILDRKKKSGIGGKLWRFETAWPIWGLQSSLRQKAGSITGKRTVISAERQTRTKSRSSMPS